MQRFAIIFAAFTLAHAATSVAGDKTGDTPAKPSSFVPHPHSNSHVYGTPIQPAIVGHSKTPHHKHTPKKPAGTSHHNP